MQNFELNSDPACDLCCALAMEVLVPGEGAARAACGLDTTPRASGVVELVTAQSAQTGEGSVG